MSVDVDVGAGVVCDGGRGRRRLAMKMSSPRMCGIE